MMEQDKIAIFDAYLQGRMTRLEEQEFEQQVQDDEVLQKELDTHRVLVSQIETEAFKKRLRTIHDQQFGQGIKGQVRPIRRLVYPLSIAASLALLLTAAWFIFRPDAPTPINLDGPELFARYYTADPGLPTTLGASDNPVFVEGMTAFKLGDYEAARSQWRQLPADLQGTDTVQYFLGLTYLETAPVDSAVIFLNTVSRSASDFQGSARWYLAMAYLQMGQIDRVKPILEEIVATNNPFSVPARALLEQLQ